MEYVKNIDDYLRKLGKPYVGTLGMLVNNLNEWGTECNGDLVQLRKNMKAAGYFGIYLAKDDITGDIVPKKWLSKCHYEGQWVQTIWMYSGRLTHHSLSFAQHRTLFFDEFNIAWRRYYHPDNHLIIQSYIEPNTMNVYRLLDWIEEGDICDCGTHYLNHNSEYEECPVCRDSNLLHSYSTQVETILGMEDTKEMLMGVELEYEGLTPKQVYKSLKGHALPKSDASIRNGVEVVTKPACIKTHKTELKKLYDAVTLQAAATTGMHVHVEAKRIGQMSLGFMLWFVNNPDNKEFMLKVAGRDFANNHYAAAQPDTKMTTGIYYDTYKRKVDRNSDRRHQALNIQKGKTYEFRIFRSPESHLEMSAKLDFVKALVDYSSPYSVHVKTLNDKVKSDNFVKFVKAHRKDYPDFVQFFKEMF